MAASPLGSARGASTVRVTTRAFADLDATTAYDLWRLRQDVFVIEQDCPYPDLDGRDAEPATRHVLAHEDGVLLGCLRVLDDGLHLRIGRVAVARSARGRGIARALVGVALEACGPAEVRLDAQTGATGLYAAFGFAVSGPAFEEDGIPHVPMTRPGGRGQERDQAR